MKKFIEDINIPDEFEVAGMKFKVNRVNKINDCNVLGSYSNAINEIQLAKIIYGDEILEDKRFNTFIHEIVHMLFSVNNRYDLLEDEILVQNLANALTEFLKPLDLINNIYENLYR